MQSFACDQRPCKHTKPVNPNFVNIQAQRDTFAAKVDYAMYTMSIRLSNDVKVDSSPLPDLSKVLGLGCLPNDPRVCVDDAACTENTTGSLVMHCRDQSREGRIDPTLATRSCSPSLLLLFQTCRTLQRLPTASQSREGLASFSLSNFRTDGTRQDRTGVLTLCGRRLLGRRLPISMTLDLWVQPIECRAAVAWEANKPLEVCKVTVDPPGPGEVRVKVCRNSIALL